MSALETIAVFAGSALIILSNGVVSISHSADRSIDYKNLVPALRDDVRETKVAHTLRVNTGKTFRLIFPDKCQEQGETELYQLTLRARVEESFLFISDLCLWIEVGFDERHNRVKLDMKFVSRVLETYLDLVFYHIQTGQYRDFENHFPAFKDFISMTLINSNLSAERRSHVRHRAMTRLGIFEYTFSNKEEVIYLIDKYKKLGLEGFEAQNLAYAYMRPEYRNEYREKIRRCHDNPGDIRQRIIKCSLIRTRAFTLRFRPFPAAPTASRHGAR